jgi:hypothetical protein
VTLGLWLAVLAMIIELVFAYWLYVNGARR